MLVKIIPTNGDTDLENQVNTFIMGKHVIDIKLTEWAEYEAQTGGYTAYIMYEPRIPEVQLQIKVLGRVGNQELEDDVNNFVLGKAVAEIKFTEWVNFKHETGGYTALVLFAPNYNPKQNANMGTSHVQQDTPPMQTSNQASDNTDNKPKPKKQQKFNAL